MTVTAYQGAVNEYYSVPENKNNSYAQIPICVDSDILPISPAVQYGCALPKVDKKRRYLLLSIPPLSNPKKKRRNVKNGHEFQRFTIKYQSQVLSFTESKMMIRKRRVLNIKFRLE